MKNPALKPDFFMGSYQQGSGKTRLLSGLNMPFTMPANHQHAHRTEQ